MEEIGIVPAVRTRTADDARFAVETLVESGIPVAEITMTVPHAVSLIADLARAFPDMIVGAGTVLDADTAHQAVDAGARFITSTGLDLAVVRASAERDIFVLPGVLTPTEVMTAMHAGVDCVKVFPCAPLGGDAYIRALRTPFPQMSFVAAGGVNQHTAIAFIRAGAVAIGVGKELLPTNAVEHRQTDWIRELAHRFVTMVNVARGLTAER